MTTLSRRRAVAAVLAGATYTHVARQAGVAVCTAWRWVQEDAEYPPVRQRRIPAETKMKIRTAIDSGQLSLRRIAVLHAVHISTVCDLRDTMVIGGHRARPVRCRNCGGLITTQVCLACNASEFSRRSSCSVA